MASEQTGASTSGGSFDKGSGLASGRTKSGVLPGSGHPWKARNLEALSESRPSRDLDGAYYMQRTRELNRSS